MANGPRATPPAPPAEYTDAQQLGITIEQPPRTLKVIRVFESELDAITSIGTSIHLTFLGISAGSLVSFIVVISTVNSLSTIQSAGFTGMVWASTIGTLYFGIQSVLNMMRARKKIAALKGDKHY